MEKLEMGHGEEGKNPAESLSVEELTQKIEELQTRMKQLEDEQLKETLRIKAQNEQEFNSYSSSAQHSHGRPVFQPSSKLYELGQEWGEVSTKLYPYQMEYLYRTGKKFESAN